MVIVVITRITTMRRLLVKKDLGETFSSFPVLASRRWFCPSTLLWIVVIIILVIILIIIIIVYFLSL